MGNLVPISLTMLIGATLALQPITFGQARHGHGLHRQRKHKLPVDALDELLTDAEIEDVVSAAVATVGDSPSMIKYVPTRRGLAKQFVGTILESTWQPVLINMMVGGLLVWSFRRFGAPGVPHPLWKPPPAGSFKWLEQLQALDKVWHYLMTLTTFTLSFFFNQSYSTFNKIVGSARATQGRLNDVGMIFSHRVKRDEATGEIVPEGKKLLAQQQRYVRLFSPLMYAGLTRRHAPLLTSRGLRRMAARGALTEGEAEAILASNCPPKHRHFVILNWLVLLHRRGVGAGLLEVDRHSASSFDGCVYNLRHQAYQFSGAEDDRVPLAYVHFVQLLTDAFIVLCPFALFPEMGGWSIIATGLLTLFYQGLLNLAKSFLDPMDNEDGTRMKGDSLNLDCLIAQTNGGSANWAHAAGPPLVVEG